MNVLSLDLEGALVLTPEDGMQKSRLSFADGIIRDARAGRRIDLQGYLVLPGIVDPHGDGFERHLAPRRGAMPDMTEGVVAAEAEFAANGLTTAVLAQFYSWEGGLRSPEYAAKVFAAIRSAKSQVVTDLMAQLRFETHMLDDYADLPGKLANWGVSYLVFNDHLPHDRLAAGRKPPRLTGQALKAGRNPDAHLDLMLELHSRAAEVPAALGELTRKLSASAIKMGSHDDQTAGQRAKWRRRGVSIAEFPETLEAAEAAIDSGDPVIMGAPNVVRGNSHNGNISATDLIAKGLCTALASDYHYPSLRRAVFKLVAQSICDLPYAWSLVSGNPARLLGLTDRGELQPGMRADLVILDAETKRIAATISGGRFSYMSGDIAARFLG
ncbi:alpha-D-ribose 1-methylphosphonate 5-triphosphate diphosphatase [Sulfitobacter sp. BDSS02]|nr:alpha-D-ribose 1-methylphosphonate 5-triphosphate diphosphatase [Sulfitobacter sp. BDSS02]MBR9848951.1 alpha-D-ribose 1-methylphosphonate 5-triphosphate diphosphatase [Paracoccaceae bacterium]